MTASRYRSWLPVTLTLLLSIGCGKQEAASNGPPKPPEVLVSYPVVQAVTNYEIFTGRTESSERVDIRARVTGYLEKAYFQEGAIVKKDDRLFSIDARTYQAEVAKAEANLAQAQAHVGRMERDLARANGLVGRQAMSREEFDRMSGDREEAQAAVGVAESNLRLAKLNLQFTEVKAPFTGQVSRRLVDPGSLVKADETILTTLIALEPMYAYFDVDERTLLRQLMQEGHLDTTKSQRLQVQIGLSDEEGFPHEGVITFMDNRVDSNTGTMWMRAQFIKPSRPIKPGIFIRVRFPLGDPYSAVLVAEQALGTDQGQKFVYVVDDKDIVSYRPVEVGRVHEGLRDIRSGLSATERLVISGLQRVRPGAQITPLAADMPAMVARGRRPEEKKTTIKPVAQAAVVAEESSVLERAK